MGVEPSKREKGEKSDKITLTYKQKDGLKLETFAPPQARDKIKLRKSLKSNITK